MARRAAPLRPLQGAVLGRARPRAPLAEDSRCARRRTALAARARRDPRGDRVARATTSGAAPSCRRSASADLDAALLRLPSVGFLAYDDERMVRTADAIRDALDEAGCCAATTPTTGCRARAPSWRARSGSSTAWPGRGASRRRARCSTARWHARTTSGSSPRSPTRRRGETARQLPQALTHLAHIEAALRLEQQL